MKTTRQRAEERRQQKLAAVQEQIDAGTLTIRRMTAKERAERHAVAPVAGSPDRSRPLTAVLAPDLDGALHGRHAPDH
jgi:hypothetical protein